MQYKQEKYTLLQNLYINLSVCVSLCLSVFPHLRHDTFFLKNTEDAHFLFYERDRVVEIQAEIDEFPVDSFLFVFLLLQHKHVMIEKLLQSLVCVVDAQLLECVQLENFKSW